MQNPDEIDRIKEVYSTVYQPDPMDLTYVWHPRNPISIYFRQAQERALVKLFNKYNLPIEGMQILDVGCGNGSFLRFIASLGTPPVNLNGVDLMPQRIEQAQILCPAQIDLRVGNAEALPYSDRFFDLVSQFTVFSSILDMKVRERVAQEMLRVLKPGGYILWYDMRISRSANTRGIDTDEILELFPRTVILTLRGLHPLRATQIAKISPYLCDLLDLVPGLRKTHYLGLFQKVEQV